MKLGSPRTNRFARIIKQIGASRPGSWFFSQTLHILDRGIYKLTSGRTTLSGMLTGVPIVVVTTTGAKTGRPHSVPLLTIAEGNRIVLIASNWGRPYNPSWYINMRANPKVLISHRGHSRAYIAEEVYGRERESCWRKAVEIYPGYEAYGRRVKGRMIPVLFLSPSSQDEGTRSRGISTPKHCRCGGRYCDARQPAVATPPFA